MAKIRYDVEDVEQQPDWEQAKPGLYPAKIIEAEQRSSDGKNDIHIIAEITDPENTYSRLHTYVHLGEASRWKVRELTDAVGLPKKGTIDTDKLVNKKIRVKVGAGTYEGEYKANWQRILPFKTEDEDDDPDDDDTTTTADADAPEEDYSEWSADDLTAELEERGIDLPATGRGAALKKKLIALLELSDAGLANEDPEDDDDDDDGEEDYESMSLADLKAAAAEAGLDVKGPKSKFVAALQAHAESGDDDGDEPEDDYDEWSVEDLIGEANDRELDLPKGRKDKAKMVALLRSDDSEDPLA